MATIKSYSDLQQSKVLAEILPLESADQTWQRLAIVGSNLNVQDELQYRHNGDIPFIYYSGIDIPCWSLAALLEILCQVKEIKNQRVTILVGRFAGNHWYVELLKAQNEKSVLLVHSKELIDACYEMIIRLHELKML